MPFFTMNWLWQQSAPFSPPVHLARAYAESPYVVIVGHEVKTHISVPSESDLVSLGKMENTGCVSRSMRGTPDQDSTSAGRTTATGAIFGGEAGGSQPRTAAHAAANATQYRVLVCIEADCSTSRAACRGARMTALRE